MVNDYDENNSLIILDLDQRQRAQALREAKEILAPANVPFKLGPKLMGWELIQLSEYILTGDTDDNKDLPQAEQSVLNEQ